MYLNPWSIQRLQLANPFILDPERVTPHNIQKLQNRVMNGPLVYPGATSITNRAGIKFSVKHLVDERSKKLQIGYVVERHLEDGDIVLFNRQ